MPRTRPASGSGHATDVGEMYEAGMISVPIRHRSSADATKSDPVTYIRPPGAMLPETESTVGTLAQRPKELVAPMRRAHAG